MKRILFLSLSQCLLCLHLSAQLGDFQLDSTIQATQKRTFVTIAANPELYGGPLKNFFIGKNYRKEWLQPVTVPVLNLSTDLGGITPKEEGGGRQTRSLEVEDAAGNKWVLRSVKKYPDNVVIPALQGTIAEKIVADGISASYPYAVLSVGTLAKAAGIPYLPNTLVFIPDHPALGKFRETYKNSLSLLELRTIDTTEKDKKSYNTPDIIPELQQTPEKRVDQLMVLKARLLDNFIMDFDRHEDQWEWVKKDSAGKTFYYPFPKDRDQAFFRITGLLPKIGRIVQPTLGQLQGLRAEAANIKTFNYVPKDFDRTFLNELDASTWSREIDAFLSAVNDTVIENAIRRQPGEIKAIRGEKIMRTLKEKRNYFRDDMMDYYRFLSRTVSIAGTNEKEQFTITVNGDGSALVEMAPVDTAGKLLPAIYSRSFTPEVTKELRLYGLEGDDKFVLRGGGNGIKIRLIGGPGSDAFVNESDSGKALVYDVSFEENALAGKGLKNKISDDPLTNEYQRLGMQYTARIPGIAFELTKEAGLFLGPTLRITKPGFRKEPYASIHYFYLTGGLRTPGWHGIYDAEFTGIAKKTDLVFRSEVFLPTVRTYFFGFGNNSVYEQQRGWEYYVTRYQQVDLSLQARYSPTTWLQVTGGPVVQYLKLLADRNKDNYASTIIPQNPTQSLLYEGQWYGGGEVRTEINLRNHPQFTTQGMHANFYGKMIRGATKNSGDYDQVGGNISFFTDFPLRRAVVLATSFGADRMWGNFQFPQAQYLGFRQKLRGYRFQRFAGDARVYNNSEIRVNLGVANFYLFKGLVGLIGFHDVGRVWMTGEESDTWHRGWGYGLWVAPFNQIVVLGTLASSKEEKNWMQVTIGFQF